MKLKICHFADFTSNFRFCKETARPMSYFWFAANAGKRGRNFMTKKNPDRMIFFIQDEFLAKKLGTRTGSILTLFLYTLV